MQPHMQLTNKGAQTGSVWVPQIVHSEKYNYNEKGYFMIHRNYEDTHQGPQEEAIVWRDPASPSTWLGLTALVRCPAFIDLGFGKKSCKWCLTFDSMKSIKGDDYDS